MECSNKFSIETFLLLIVVKNESYGSSSNFALLLKTRREYFYTYVSYLKGNNENDLLSFPVHSTPGYNSIMMGRHLKKEENIV